MDGFLQTPPGQSREAHSSKMAPVSPASSCSEPEQPTLADIGAEIRRLAANMVTKSDLQSLTTTLTASLTSAVTALRTDMEAQDGRIQALETQAQATQRQASAADTALTRQGNMLLALRRQVEDLDNRSRRSNIRVRHHNEWIAARWPEEIPRFLQRLDLPSIAVPDWILEPLDREPRPQRQPRNPRRGPRENRTPDIPPHPSNPEE
ncbi:Hypothetical predicted protein [Pelobates cultripes]|uniref:Uncharacterized protein n=1 Tax=Pelobates cultripes TaxID=61616 RepID=A0AAD1W5V2_PELCU|nr:Hypothetical predicted protein [Pelobates cultripes]